MSDLRTEYRNNFMNWATNTGEKDTGKMGFLKQKLMDGKLTQTEYKELVADAKKHGNSEQDVKNALSDILGKDAVETLSNINTHSSEPIAISFEKLDKNDNSADTKIVVSKTKDTNSKNTEGLKEQDSNVAVVTGKGRSQKLTDEYKNQFNPKPSDESTSLDYELSKSNSLSQLSDLYDKIENSNCSPDDKIALLNKLKEKICGLHQNDTPDMPTGTQYAEYKLVEKIDAKILNYNIDKCQNSQDINNNLEKINQINDPELKKGLLEKLNQKVDSMPEEQINSCEKISLKENIDNKLKEITNENKPADDKNQIQSQIDKASNFSELNDLYIKINQSSCSSEDKKALLESLKNKLSNLHANDSPDTMTGTQKVEAELLEKIDNSLSVLDSSQEISKAENIGQVTNLYNKIQQMNCSPDEKINLLNQLKDRIDNLHKNDNGRLTGTQYAEAKLKDVISANIISLEINNAKDINDIEKSVEKVDQIRDPRLKNKLLEQAKEKLNSNDIPTGINPAVKREANQKIEEKQKEVKHEPALEFIKRKFLMTYKGQDDQDPKIQDFCKRTIQDAEQKFSTVLNDMSDNELKKFIDNLKNDLPFEGIDRLISMAEDEVKKRSGFLVGASPATV